MHQGVDHGYHDLPHQVVSIEGYNNYFKVRQPYVQHSIPFQNSRGIKLDTVVGSRGRLLGREPSLRSLIATLFWLNSFR